MPDARPKALVIAIDGPAASGKGTLSRRLAEHLHFAHLDTGSLYRAVGLAVLRAGGDPSNAAQATEAAYALHPETTPRVLADPALRADEVASAASQVAVVPAVREALLAFQRDFAAYPPQALAAPCWTAAISARSSAPTPTRNFSSPLPLKQEPNGA